MRSTLPSSGAQWFALALCLMLLAGCFAASEEGQRLSNLGGSLILNGHSNDILNADFELGQTVQAVCGNGAGAVYPIKGDITSPIGDSSATHHLFLRCSKGDVVIRLLYETSLDKFRVIEYFRPKRLSHLGGRWWVERFAEADSAPSPQGAASFEDGFAAYSRTDYQTALRIWRPLAERGNASAQFYVGQLYATGKGVQQDDGQAVAWSRRAAEAGVAEAQNNLGMSYLTGSGVARDPERAIFWLRKAAEQGEPKAQFNLGTLHDNDRGDAQEDQQAAYWYRKAADLDHAESQYNLGVMYSKGRGVPKDDEQAVRWYRKAAEQGLAIAQNNLAGMYVTGRGVPSDDRQAYFWYLLASAGGNNTNARIRGEIEARLTGGERAAVRADTDKWRSRRQ